MLRPTVSRPVYLGVKPHLGPKTRFLLLSVVGLLKWGSLSDERMALASAVIIRSESRGTQDNILLSQIRDSSNLECQVPVFISPRNRVAQLYPQALGSLFVASYDSQNHGGGIRPRLHTGSSGKNQSATFLDTIWSL
jgi:hypothetical protein